MHIPFFTSGSPERLCQAELSFDEPAGLPSGLERSRRDWAANKEKAAIADLLGQRVLAGPQMAPFVGLNVAVRLGFIRHELRGTLRVTGAGKFEVAGQPFLESDQTSPPDLIAEPSFK